MTVLTQNFIIRNLVLRKSVELVQIFETLLLYLEKFSGIFGHELLILGRFGIIIERMQYLDTVVVCIDRCQRCLFKNCLPAILVGRFEVIGLVILNIDADILADLDTVLSATEPGSDLYAILGVDACGCNERKGKQTELFHIVLCYKTIQY